MLTPTRHRKVWRGLCYEPKDENYKLTKEELEAIQQEMQEVEERTKQIRAGWSPEEMAKRVVGSGGHIPWTVPEYTAVYVAPDPAAPSRREKRTKVYRRLS